MKTIILASNNVHKLKEIRAILSDYSVVSLAEAGINVDPEETGKTFLENALIKAKAVYEVSGKPALADDSGLAVEALDGAPGVMSARYCGRHGADVDNNNLLLHNLQGVENRRAKFVSAVVLYRGNNDWISAIGETLGEIMHAPHGNGGFGYDPVFYSYDLQKSFGEATDAQKNSVSHRSRALHALIDKLRNND